MADRRTLKYDRAMALAATYDMLYYYNGKRDALRIRIDESPHNPQHKEKLEKILVKRRAWKFAYIAVEKAVRETKK